MNPKPRILLLAPIHDWKAYLLQCADELQKHDQIVSIFPKWQAHAGWKRALEQLDIELETFVYTHSTLINPKALTLIRPLLNPLAQRIEESATLRYLLDIQAQKPWDSMFRRNHILKIASTFKPDFIFISGGTGLTAVGKNTLFELKNLLPLTRLVLFNGTSPYEDATAMEKSLLPVLDTVITNDESHSKGWLSLGAKRSWPLPISAIDPDQTKSILASEEEKKRYKSDICFIGTLKPESRYKDRLQALNALTELDLSIWTTDKEILEPYPQLMRKYRGPASNKDIFKIYQSSKIGLNIHGSYMPSGANLRTFEIPAAGCLQAVDHTLPGLFEPGKECILFKNKEDLRTQVSAVLKDDARRQHIADAGMKRTYSDHTYKQRFAHLLNLLNA